jgi:hypothetical protein
VDGARRREEGERGRDDFIAAADVQSAQGQQQCVRAARTADGVLGVGKLGDLLLQTLDGGAKDEQLGFDDLHHLRHDLVADRGMLGTQVKQWYRHQLKSK